jgi:hypothetical protein
MNRYEYPYIEILLSQTLKLVIILPKEIEY